MFPSRRSRCFLFQAQNHRSVRVTTSRNQQRTKEERSVLLYNNRWICLLPFARKPDPRRASKQVSREPPPLAWFVPRRRPNEKRRRQANSARRRPEKLRDRSAAISLLFSLGFRLRCSRRAAARPAARYSQGTARGQKLIAEKRLCCFSFCAGDEKRGRATPLPGP